MQAALEILGVITPVFAMGLMGLLWAKSGQEFPTAFVTQVSMSLATPCLLFVTLARAELDGGVFGDLALATLAAYGLAGLLTAVMCLVGRLDMRVWLAPITFGNTGNVGLPVALFAFGQEGFVYAAVVFAVMAVMNFTLGVWLVAGAAGGGGKAALRQPITWGAAAGLLFAVTGWDLPDPAMESLALTGQMAIPLMLLTLGVSVARLTVRGIGGALVVSVVRLAICAGAALVAAWWAGLDRHAADALVLQLVMPVAVTSYMLAERYRRDPVTVAGLVVVSTALSVLAIPAALAVMMGDGPGALPAALGLIGVSR